MYKGKEYPNVQIKYYMKGGILMSIPAFFATLWGAVASPSGQAVIGMLNLGGTAYTAVKATQNSNKLSSLQSTCYGIATELKEVKSNTSDLFTISDMEDLISSSTAPLPASAPASTPTQTQTQTQTPAPTTPTAPAEPAQDNMPPAWAQQLMQQQLQQAEVIKTLMQQNTASAVPANTTVNVNPTTPAVPTVSSVPIATAVATVPGSVPEASPAPAPALDTTPAPATVDPAIMAFLQQQAEAMNKLANAVTALETSIEALEAATDDTPVVVVPPTPPTTTTTPPTPPVGG